MEKKLIKSPILFWKIVYILISVLLIAGAFTIAITNPPTTSYAYQIAVMYSDGTSEVLEHHLKITSIEVPEVKLDPSGCIYAINEKGEKEYIACDIRRFLVIATADVEDLKQGSKKRRPARQAPEENRIIKRI